MRSKDPVSVAVNVIKREDKLETLKGFIRQTLATHSANGETQVWTVVARSTASPVAQALVSLGTDLMAAGIKVRAIFTNPELPHASAGWLQTGNTVAFTRDMRWAKPLAMNEAHEQLVLGPVTSWIGDCMRRDPLKRDAFERYAANCPLTADFARTSFENIWRISTPLSITVPQRVTAVQTPSIDKNADITPPAEVVGATSIPAGEPSAFTRH
jgi:hypothetical protein